MAWNDNNSNNTFYLRSAFQDIQGHFTGGHQSKTMDKKLINLKHPIEQHSDTQIQKKKKNTINNIQNINEHTVYNNW